MGFDGGLDHDGLEVMSLIVDVDVGTLSGVMEVGGFEVSVGDNLGSLGSRLSGCRRLGCLVVLFCILSSLFICGWLFLLLFFLDSLVITWQRDFIAFAVTFILTKLLLRLVL